MTEREFISLLTDRGYVSHSPGVLCLPGVDRSEVLFTHTRAGVLGDWQSFEDALRRLGVDVPGDPTEHAIYTCTDCPCCKESAVEDRFYYRHPGHPDEARDALDVFGKILDWCPIRMYPLLLVVQT